MIKHCIMSPIQNTLVFHSIVAWLIQNVGGRLVKRWKLRPILSGNLQALALGLMHVLSALLILPLFIPLQNTASVWAENSHGKQLDHILNSAMWTITGTLKTTPQTGCLCSQIFLHLISHRQYTILRLCRPTQISPSIKTCKMYLSPISNHARHSGALPGPPRDLGFDVQDQWWRTVLGK